jgi:hypothetical protein
MRRGASTSSGPRAAGAVLALAMLAGAPGFAQTAGPLGIGVEASYTTDDNVTRAKGADALADRILGVGIRANYPVPISEHTRAVLQGFAGTERFQTYNGLSNYFYGAQGNLDYRASGEFGAPRTGRSYAPRRKNTSRTCATVTGTRSA